MLAPQTRREPAREAPGLRQALAAELGRERRQLFLVSTLFALAAPLLPYLTGTWETAWFALASSQWPLPVRAGLFLLGTHLALAVAFAPIAFYQGYCLPRRFGLSRQTGTEWLVDWLKTLGVSVGLSAAAGGGFLWCATRVGTSWWWAYGVFLTLGIVLLVFLLPYVLVPLFFHARPLNDPELERRLKVLLDRARVPVRAVQQLDFSRRTAEANAAVLGLGRSRRLVLADTLLAQFSPEEVEAVVAHEVAHHAHRDVPRSLAVHLFVLWVGLLIAGRWADVALPVLSLPYLGYVPGYPELLVVANFYLLVTLPLTNWWSRRTEREADRFALVVLPRPRVFASALERLASQNLLELAPPLWAQLLLGSHPTVQQRLDMAQSWPTT